MDPFEMPDGDTLREMSRDDLEALRGEAADALRHTYAVYHLKQFNNPNILTRRFKHMNSQQIRRRFGHYNDISTEDVQNFWEGYRL